ncbi:hypothetical protein B0H13DRAFT_1872210 [Mycena leptocephala]|nr:hypothetical protein B0H13DRAFT_1872210 [Mycena leptocephala]
MYLPIHVAFLQILDINEAVLRDKQAFESIQASAGSDKTWCLKKTKGQLGIDRRTVEIMRSGFYPSFFSVDILVCQLKSEGIPGLGSSLSLGLFERNRKLESRRASSSVIRGVSGPGSSPAQRRVFDLHDLRKTNIELSGRFGCNINRLQSTARYEYSKFPVPRANIIKQRAVTGRKGKEEMRNKEGAFLRDLACTHARSGCASLKNGRSLCELRAQAPARIERVAILTRRGSVNGSKGRIVNAWQRGELRWYIVHALPARNAVFAPSPFERDPGRDVETQPASKLLEPSSGDGMGHGYRRREGDKRGAGDERGGAQRTGEKARRALREWRAEYVVGGQPKSSASDSHMRRWEQRLRVLQTPVEGPIKAGSLMTEALRMRLVARVVSRSGPRAWASSSGEGLGCTAAVGKEGTEGRRRRRTRASQSHSTCGAVYSGCVDAQCSGAVDCPKEQLGLDSRPIKTGSARALHMGLMWTPGVGFEQRSVIGLETAAEGRESTEGRGRRGV